MVVETEWFESKEKLDADVMWWLKESQGEVRTCVTFSVHRTERQVDLESWKLVPRPPQAELFETVADRTNIYNARLA